MLKVQNPRPEAKANQMIYWGARSNAQIPCLSYILVQLDYLVEF